MVEICLTLSPTLSRAAFATGRGWESFSYERAFVTVNNVVPALRMGSEAPLSSRLQIVFQNWSSAGADDCRSETEKRAKNRVLKRTALATHRTGIAQGKRKRAKGRRAMDGGRQECVFSRLSLQMFMTDRSMMRHWPSRVRDRCPSPGGAHGGGGRRVRCKKAVRSDLGVRVHLPILRGTDSRLVSSTQHGGGSNRGGVGRPFA